MDAEKGISFGGVAGLTPAGSTHADAIRLLGEPGELARQADAVLGDKVVKGGVLAHYPAQGLAVVFDCDGEPENGSPVRVVLAAGRCRLGTVEGLFVGMARGDALAVVKRSYSVRRAFRQVLYLLPLDREAGDTELGVGFEDGRVAYIGLYRR